MWKVTVQGKCARIIQIVVIKSPSGGFRCRPFRFVVTPTLELRGVGPGKEIVPGSFTGSRGDSHGGLATCGEGSSRVTPSHEGGVRCSTGRDI